MLIVVAVLVALALAGVVVGFKRKFRAERRLLGGATILDEIAEDALFAQHREEAAAEGTTKSQAAQLDSGIEAFRTRTRPHESPDVKDAADMREQLKD
ncbi:hypothetical protein [Mycobacterium antarcticum]|uniref:hypothetical protein n=1 Tax=unclassified Mycolicibacterium TaxID=2636767 RepID=UPI0024E0DB21|nr:MULTISPECIES: hypothetical protein [unclassified Mycolicibacterium]